MSEIAEEVARAKTKHEIEVCIEYNGLPKKIEIDPNATVKTLLDRAISAYGNLPQPHTLALWNAQGVELTNEQETLRDAHVKDSDVLTLRPSVVKGG